MANVIALIWDFDKTLINGYMQDPIFEEYGIDGIKFWNEVNALPKFYMENQGVRVNEETIYLNHILNYVKDGKFAGLSNKKLREFGKKLSFYNGMPEFMRIAKEKVADDPVYAEYDIKVENYVVSTGLAEIIRGSEVYDELSGLWGCEFIEKDGVISEVVYTIDNTTKTRGIFEINKGVGKDREVTVNTMIPEENRRVKFKNMIYIADGPSDIPAFSVVKKNGGHTFAIYPKGNMEAMKQVDQMRNDGRIDMFAEADYSENTTAYMWLMATIDKIAKEIREDEKGKISKYENVKGPIHLK